MAGFEAGFDQLAIAIGADSIPRVCRRRNLDWRTIADENGEAIRYAASKGFPVMIGQPGQARAEQDDAPNGKA